MNHKKIKRMSFVDPTTALPIRDSIKPKSIHTIFYQGIICDQSQATKYYGGKEIDMTTFQKAKCIGRNDLEALDVLIEPFIGKEIKDVNTTPFSGMLSYFNPLNVLESAISKIQHWYYGINFQNSDVQNKEDLAAHGLHISEISIGQETDIESHYEKYKLWKEKYPDSELILWGVSRGAVTSFNAFAKYKYPEVKLVVLEGCFYAFSDVLNNWFPEKVASWVGSGISLFTKYRANGPSPGANINDFPENVPVVLITSDKDHIVPPSSTEKLAKALADRGKNDVYLLRLKNSSHPSYMFDDQVDRDNYECLIHAVYKKYGIRGFNDALAERGKIMLSSCQLKQSQAQTPTARR